MKTAVGFGLAILCAVAVVGCGGPGEVKIPENSEKVPESEDLTKSATAKNNSQAVSEE